MLRVLVPLHSFEPGGVERVALRLADAWREQNVSLHLVLGRNEGRPPSFASDLQFDVLQLGRVSTRAFETLWMILHLPGRIRRSRPDVIFCPGNSYAVIGVAMKILLGRACPPILLKISNDLRRADMSPPGRLAYRLWCRIKGRLIDRFTALAEPMQDEICATLGVCATRVAVVDDPALSRAQLAELQRLRAAHVHGRSGRHFLAVGRLAPQKDFPLLVRAFARIAGPDDRLVILGEGPDRSKIQRLVRALGLERQVMLPGHVDSTAPWLAACDIFAMSSRYEGVPAVLIEAMAAGLPIVATDCSVSMSSLLGVGRLGRLVPVGDEQGLAQAMDAVPTTNREAMRNVADRFTVERAASLYLASFAELIRHRASRCGEAVVVSS